MPYKDPAKRLAHLADWRRKNRPATRKLKQKPPQAVTSEPRKKRKKRKKFRIEREDEQPTACWHRFHTTRPCPNVARWVSPTHTKWCDKHAAELLGLKPYTPPTGTN